ncbi:MAG: hypothetical protein U0136_08635 [Bdellovibrionota bacterium]
MTRDKLLTGALVLLVALTALGIPLGWYRFHLWLDGVPFFYPTESTSTLSLFHTLLWLPRFVILLSVHLLADIAAIDLDNAFAVFCLAALLGTSYFLARCCQLLLGREGMLAGLMLFTYLQLSVVALAVNGRITIAFLGFAMVLWEVLAQRSTGDRSVGYSYQLPLGLLLSSMSSGALAVTFFFFILTGVGELRRASTATAQLTRNVPIAVIAVLTLGFVAKNFLFFEQEQGMDAGRILADFLLHGAGGIVVNALGGVESAAGAQTLLVLLAFLSAYCVFLVWVVTRVSNELARIVSAALAVTLVVGLVGYFALSMVLVPGLVFSNTFVFSRGRAFR